MEQRNDVEETFRYDPEGRVVEKNITVKVYDGGGVHKTTYEYDLIGNTTKWRSEDQAESFGVVYRFDRIGQVCAVEGIDGPQGRPIPFAAYAYNADGSLAQETFYPNSGAPLIRSYRYNSHGNLTELKDPYFSETLEYTQGYDGYVSHTGRILAAGCQFSGFTPENSGFVTAHRWQYVYDHLGRLKSAYNEQSSMRNYGSTKPLQFDANSNLKELPRQKHEEFAYYQGTNRLEKVSTQKDLYQYDADGRVSSAPARDIVKIDYDPLSDRVLRIIAHRGQTEKKLSFAYDSKDSRVFKQMPDSSKLYILSPKGKVLAEKTDGSGTSTAYSIYGPTGLIGIRKQGRTYYLIKDHSGSTRGIVDGTRICAAYNYDPFGSFAGGVYEPSERVTGYLYTGQELDAETGLYNFKARLYDPYLGRFYSQDPAEQFASPYIYAGGDPINFIDPSGEWTWSLENIAATVAGIAVVMAGAVSLQPEISAGGFMLISAAIGAGFASAGYGVSKMAADQDFNLAEWGIITTSGAIFGAGQGAIYSAGLGAAGSALAGAGLGAAEGFVTNGALNTLNGNDFTAGGWQAAGIGAAIGFASSATFRGAVRRAVRGQQLALMEAGVNLPGSRGTLTSYAGLRQQPKIISRQQMNNIINPRSVLTQVKFSSNVPMRIETSVPILESKSIQEIVNVQAGANMQVFEDMEHALDEFFKAEQNFHATHNIVYISEAFKV